jgi:hypothetical protein
MANSQEKFDEIVKKVEVLKKSGAVDLSLEEDLTLAVMNLISLEEHFFFTAEKTGKSEYFDFLNEVRSLRKELLGKMIDRHEGETWCVSKHLLATAMRLIEVGTKLRADKKIKEAEEIFLRAYKMYSIFWALRLKLIRLPEVKKMAAEEKPWSLENIMNKLVDCCDE